MERFDPVDEASHERLLAFWKAMWTRLVPPSGQCVSVQGELVRAKERLQNEYLRNGMMNYYGDPDEEESFGDTQYSEMLLFIVDRMIANANNALRAEDLAYFQSFRPEAITEWTNARRLANLEELAEDPGLSDAEQAEYDTLSAEDGPNWDDFFERAELCIANWCVANPGLIDRDGKAVSEGGVKSVGEVVG